MSSNFSRLREYYHTWKLPWWEVSILLIFFVLFPLGQLERIGFTAASKIYYHDLVCIVWLISQQRYLRNFLLKQKLSAVWKAWRVEILCIIWLVVSLGISLFSSHSITPLLYATRILIYGVFAWSVGKRLGAVPFLLRILIAIAGGWYWWLATLQYIFLPDTRFLWLYGWDEHYYRMIGTLFDPGFTGILLVLVLLVVWSCKKIVPPWLFIIANCAFIVGIALTYSRASYVALFFVLVCAAFFSRRKLAFTKQKIGIVLAAVVLIGGAVMFAPRPGGDGVQLMRTTSAKARILSIQQAFSQLSLQDWVIGKGLFSSTAEPQAPTETPTDTTHSFARMPDNIFITLLTHAGSVGLILGIVVLGKIAVRLYRKQPLFFLALLAVIIHSQFNNTLLQPFILLYLLLFLAS